MSAPHAGESLWRHAGLSASFIPRQPAPFIPQLQRLPINVETESLRSSAVTSVRSRQSESVRTAREPRAFPASGASKDYEKVHQRFHDGAAGHRDTWWLQQRDLAREYTKANGIVVAGPATIREYPRSKSSRADGTRQVERRVHQAFDHAAGKANRGPLDVVQEGLALASLSPLRHRTVEDAASEDRFGRRRPPNPEGVRVNPAHGASVIDSVLLGRDIDKSDERLAAQRQLELEAYQGAAGRKYLGTSPRKEGLRTWAGKNASDVDEVVHGRDIDTSGIRLAQHAGAKVFRGAAGKAIIGQSPRREGVKVNPAGLVSHVDDVVFGKDIDNSDARVQMAQGDPQLQGAAGHRPRGGSGRGLRHFPAGAISNVDQVVLGRDIDKSVDRVAEHLRMEDFQNAAGRKYMGHVSRERGLRPNPVRDRDHWEVEEFKGAAGMLQEHPSGLRQIPLGKVEQVGSVVYGRDVTRSTDILRASEASPEMQGYGRKLIGSSPRPEGIKQVAGSGLSEMDEVIFGRDIDGSRDRRGAPERARRRAIGFPLSERSYR
eukprot:TRINITY_DN16805_c0_g1_i1.p1 TRINITY_DN16805_c0_g1~~TRINITY_DN16805_c0_g1_i1.p1  ORF type:complete len:546 (+),score=71.20 TRINITY_DN16805_c0_g1_i1:149-1786(+)